MMPMFLLLFIVVVLVFLWGISGISAFAGDTAPGCVPTLPPATATWQVYVRHGGFGRALTDKSRILCQFDRDVSASRDDGDDGIHPSHPHSPSEKK